MNSSFESLFKKNVIKHEFALFFSVSFSESLESGVEITMLYITAFKMGVYLHLALFAFLSSLSLINYVLFLL